MPRTRATRTGNGSGGTGWGGPAKGAGKPPGNKLGGRPRKEVAPIIAMAKEARLSALKDHLIELALTAERDSDQIAATLGYLKHEDAAAAPERREVTIRTNVDRTLDQ